MTAAPSRVVIAGAGQGGLQAASTLREAGYAGAITLVGDEACLPYQRPPLSKGMLNGAFDAQALVLEELAFFARQQITLMVDVRIDKIDRAEHRLRLSDGSSLDYGHLVLATGARNRLLPDHQRALQGVHSLRSLDDGASLCRELGGARNLVVIGGGFLGLEVASVAAGLGTQVTVVEATGRVMERVASREVSEFFQCAHEAAGVRFALDARVGSIEDVDGRVAAVVLDSGTRLAADLVLVAIGVQPNDELAQEAGLAVDNGILVDAWLRTSDPAISAIGDCSAFPFQLDGGQRVRLESVQNAVDQGAYIARRLMGQSAPYAQVPIFWSEQAGRRLQMAGVTRRGDASVVRGDIAQGQFSVFRYRADRLVCVESVNRPGDHMAARKLLAAGLSPSPLQASDLAFDLRQYASAALAA
jgi:3-phenylpropionate/trans-cinnamate dioxygenase ferredoxin reductase subunit